jgi:hypothetical protein
VWWAKHYIRPHEEEDIMWWGWGMMVEVSERGSAGKSRSSVNTRVMLRMGLKEQSFKVTGYRGACGYRDKR